LDVFLEQTAEVPVNNDTQSTGGKTRYSKKSGAVNGFYLTAEYGSMFLSELRHTNQVNKADFHLDEMQKPRLGRKSCF